jgi:hypothetical protein
MLVQQIAGTIRSLLVERALRFGSAKPCPVGLRLFRRLFSLAAFLKSFQVDHVTHARSHHAISWWHAALSRRRDGRCWALEHFPARLNPVGVRKILPIINPARIPIAKPLFAFAKYVPAGSVVIRKIPHSEQHQKKVPSCKNEIICALARASVAAIAQRYYSLGVMTRNYFSRP